jgi:hypothetical protein
MIFRSVPNPAVRRHRGRRAVSNRFAEVAVRRKPSPNVRNRHRIVVGLWWALRISDHLRHTLRYRTLSAGL